MNRIRKNNKSYQVLISPHQKYNTGFEFLIGSWTDEGLMGFDVIECKSYCDAEAIAYNYPDINWEQLVNIHKDPFVEMKNTINEIIKEFNMIVEFKAKLFTPEQTKNKMFDRIVKGYSDINNDIGEDSCFRLAYDMNDIISFAIVNPWTKNLNEIEKILINHHRLNIFRKMEKNNIVHLIGRTDIGTTYEILLIPSVIYNWMEWKNNNNVSINTLEYTFKNCIKTQKLIDSTISIR
jgi:hypothetical protein